MDQLPRLGKRELICLLLFTCYYVVSVWRCFLFLWVLGMGYVILLCHSLSLPYNHLDNANKMSRVVRKPGFCICENKDADQLRGNREADQRLCFRYTEIQSLYFLNSKFQASSHLQWLHSPVCVGPGRKPRIPVFSQRGSNTSIMLTRP